MRASRQSNDELVQRAYTPCSACLPFRDGFHVDRTAPGVFLIVVSIRGYCRDSSRIGRISMLPSRAGGIFEATWIASFKSLASMR